MNTTRRILFILLCSVVVLARTSSAGAALCGNDPIEYDHISDCYTGELECDDYCQGYVSQCTGVSCIREDGDSYCSNDLSDTFYYCVCLCSGI